MPCVHELLSDILLLCRHYLSAQIFYAYRAESLINTVFYLLAAALCFCVVALFNEEPLFSAILFCWSDYLFSTL